MSRARDIESQPPRALTGHVTETTHMKPMRTPHLSPGYVLATSTPSAFLLADRATAWNPGMMEVGDIPVRTTVCSTLPPVERAGWHGPDPGHHQGLPGWPSGAACGRHLHHQQRQLAVTN